MVGGCGSPTSRTIWRTGAQVEELLRDLLVGDDDVGVFGGDDFDTVGSLEQEIRSPPGRAWRTRRSGRESRRLRSRCHSDRDFASDPSIAA